MARVKNTKASTPKKAVTPKAKNGKPNGSLSTADILLSTLGIMRTERGMSTASFADIMKARKMNDRNTGWRNEWRKLIEDGFLKPSQSSEGGPIFTSGYQLTEKGEDRAETPDQKALKRLMEETVKTTDEEHARIRKLCMNRRAIQIFDLLLKHGSLTRKELAAMIGISDRGAPFSYGLRHLKRLGYIVVDEGLASPGNKKLRLSEKCFVCPDDRPKPVPIEPETMKTNMEKVYGKEMQKAAAARSKSSKKEAIVKEIMDDAVGKDPSAGDKGLTTKKEERNDDSTKRSKDSGMVETTISM